MKLTFYLGALQALHSRPVPHSRLVLYSRLVFHPRQPLLARPFVTEAEKVASARRELLEKIYEPFAKLDKNSPEYNELATSGRVWEDYWQPGDSDKYGYTRVQQEVASTLLKIDTLKNAMSVPASVVAKQLVNSYAQQSAAIEGNRLNQSESMVIDEQLRSEVFSKTPLGSMSADDIRNLDLPDPSVVLPQADKLQLIELRNHLVASHWISETSPRAQCSSGLDESEVRALSALTMRDLDPHEKNRYPTWCGDPVMLGGYRTNPAGIKSNPLAVFPYPLEVDACMRRFFQWRQRVSEEKELHPVIIACQTVVYFLHIHPFPDGNGRVSRMIMHDYLLRHGYIPIVFTPFSRPEYLRMMMNAQDGRPGEFVSRVVTIQLEWMQTFQLQDMARNSHHE
ncbi:fic/DOC family protein [Durotheca rogersii]|uniref:fic/DOC family protein n=1 Tax=Durotheca rogersii TaxID=419775 RepID=UPI002220D85D|nr:fic/DOC family protein [Durotheca rogersii]KAI5862440.1 fic/DOC family protein [Durotheca rogersii]